MNIRSNGIPCFSKVTLLDISINSQLKFKKHMEDLSKKAFFKVHLLWRIRRYLVDEKARFLANAFFECQFNEAPLIWIVSGKTKSANFTTKHFSWSPENTSAGHHKTLQLVHYKTLQLVHHKTLQLVHYEYDKSYEELLQLNNNISIHLELEACK